MTSFPLALYVNSFQTIRKSPQPATIMASDRRNNRSDCKATETAAIPNPKMNVGIDPPRTYCHLFNGSPQVQYGVSALQITPNDIDLRCPFAKIPHVSPCIASCRTIKTTSRGKKLHPIRKDKRSPENLVQRYITPTITQNGSIIRGPTTLAKITPTVRSRLR